MELLELSVQRSIIAIPVFGRAFKVIQWIGLRENLQETMVFTIKYRAFL
jgi:hypothetical protein